MATIHNFSEGLKRREAKGKETKPEAVILYGVPIKKGDDTYQAVFRVPVLDGDHSGLIAHIIKNFGIWNNEGTLFLPWPPALVSIDEATPEEIASGLKWQEIFILRLSVRRGASF